MRKYYVKQVLFTNPWPCPTNGIVYAGLWIHNDSRFHINAKVIPLLFMGYAPVLIQYGTLGWKTSWLFHELPQYTIKNSGFTVAFFATCRTNDNTKKSTTFKSEICVQIEIFINVFKCMNCLREGLCKILIFCQDI